MKIEIPYLNCDDKYLSLMISGVQDFLFADPNKSQHLISQIQINNGVIYVGQITGCLVPHGYGRILDPQNKMYYEGCFTNGLKHGRGTVLQLDDMQAYSGEFDQDKLIKQTQHILIDNLRKNILKLYDKEMINSFLFSSSESSKQYASYSQQEKLQVDIELYIIKNLKNKSRVEIEVECHKGERNQFLWEQILIQIIKINSSLKYKKALV